MADKKREKIDDGSIPNHVVNQLIEHTIGGFIVFYFNNKTGEPEQLMTFDTPAHYLALQKYISDWQDAVEHINHDNSILSIKEGIKEALNPESDDEEEGD